jgi:aspartate/methionine/tyrosine aminotransferase
MSKRCTPPDGVADDRDGGARAAAAARVCKLRRLEASGATASEARCAARAISALISRHALDDAALTEGAARDAAPVAWESERLLHERPAQEFLLTELRARGRTLRNAAGTSAGEELGLVFGAEKLSHSLLTQWVRAQRPATLFDLAHRECAAHCVADVQSGLASGSASFHQLVLGRPACGHSDVGGALAAAVADMYSGRVLAPDVLAVPPEAGMTLTLRALLSHGDLVICQWPHAPLIYDLLTDIGCRTLYWRPEPGPAGGLHYSLRTFEALLTSSSPAVDPRAVLLAMPSDPIGWLPSSAGLASLLEACNKRGAYVVSEEQYLPLVWDDEAARLPAVAEAYELGVSVSSLGGSFGLPGLRCGWVACTNRALLQRISELQSFNSDSSVCSPNDALALAALQPATWRTLLRRNREVLLANQALLHAFMARHAATFAFTPPMAGPSAFAQLVGERALSSAEFCRRLVQSQGVLLLPGVCYDVRPAASHAVGRSSVLPASGAWLSIAFGSAHFPEALAVLDGALSRLGHTLGLLALLGAPGDGEAARD